MPARFFQPAQSQQYVPTYAPLPLDAISRGAEQAREVYEQGEQALDTYTATHQDMLQQLTPQNREKAQQILQADSEFIDKISDPDTDVPFQDMVPLIRRQARKTTQQIQPYLEDSARIKEFRGRVDDLYDKGDLSLSLRNYYDRQLQDYQGLEVGEDGRTKGFKPPPVVRKVDINKKIDDFMQHVAGGNEQILIDEFGVDNRFIKEIRQKGRSAEGMQGVRNLIASRLLNEPETRDYMEAEYQAEVDQRNRQGEDPIEFSEFVSNWVNPYAMANSMPQRTERLRSNPGFSVEDFNSMPMAGELLIGSRSSNITTPGSFLDTINETQEMYESQQEQSVNELRQQGLDATIDEDTGRIVVADPVVDGTDFTPTINKYNNKLKIARDNIDRIRAYDERVRKEAGLTDWGEQEEQYEEELLNAYRRWNRPQGTLALGEADRMRGLQGKTDKEIWNEFRKSSEYKEALESSSPAYKRYVEKLHENAKGGHRKQPISSLGSKGDKFMEDYLSRFNPSLEDGKTREPIEDEDRTFDVRDAEFTGIFTDDGGRMMAAYQVYEENDEGIATDPKLVLTEAPPEARQLMFQAGDYDGFDAITYSHLAGLSDEPGGRREASIPITDAENNPTGAEVQVRLLDRSSQNPERQYEVLARRGDGHTVHYEAANKGDIARLYRELYRRVNQPNKTDAD